MNQFRKWLDLLRKAWSRVDGAIAPEWDRFYWTFVWGLAVVALIMLMLFKPAPGMAAIVCGAFVALVVLRDTTRTQNFFCVVLAVAFVCIEIASIHRDREEQDTQHATDEKLLREDFQASEDHVEKVLNETKQVLKNVTGGDSYPVLVVQSWKNMVLNRNPDRSAIHFTMRNAGGYELHSISAYIDDYDAVNQIPDLVFNRVPDIFVPDIAAGDFIPVTFTYPVSQLTNREKILEISIHTQNGYYIEHISFRLSKGQAPWAYRHEVLKFVVDPSDPTNRFTKVLDQSIDWSDGGPNNLEDFPKANSGHP